MKILFVGRNCQVGGGSTFRYRASLGLVPNGHQITLVAGKGAMAPDFRALGVRHVQVPQSPFNRAHLVALLRRERFDLIHSVTPTAGDDVAWALRFVPPRNRPAWVLSIHGVLPAQVKVASDNPCLLGADEMICFDNFALKRLRSIPGLETREIHLVPRPVEEHPMPAEARAEAANSQRLVMVSRLSKSKGKTAFRALEAVESLLPEFPDLQFKIIGDGSQHGEIARQCAELNTRIGHEVASAPGFLVHPFSEMERARGVLEPRMSRSKRCFTAFQLSLRDMKRLAW
jgi:glycosyltransferase involved in cell wall biosynthesis